MDADRRHDEGASAAEYALLASAIAALIVVIVFILGGVVNGLFQKTCDNVQSQANVNQAC